MVSPNADGNGTPKSRNLLLLQRLKQARAEDDTQENQVPSAIAPNVAKKFVHKKSLRPSLSSSSSSGISENNRLQLIRRSTIQEQLFAAQCQSSRQKFQNYRSTSSASKSTNSACTINQMQRPQERGNSKQRYQKYKRRNNRNNSNSSSNNNSNNNNNNHYDDDNQDSNDDVNDNAHDYSRGNESDEESNTEGLLHLKKRLELNDCEDFNYFRGSSRINDIDWSLINGKTNEENEITLQKVFKNVNFPKETDQISDVLPIADSDFINFVNNATSNDTVYRVHNNLKENIKNTSDSPIIKIQKVISQCKADAITVTQEIKEAFEPLQESPKLIDLIDTVAIQQFPIQDSPSPISKLQNFKGSLDVHSIMHQIQKRNIQDFKRSQLKETKAESVNILISSNRIAKRKKMIDECDDDMFDFVKPTPPSTPSVLVSNMNSSKKIDIDENSDPELVSRKLIDKFEKSRKSKVYDMPLDSDDVSTERSSELDDLSATRRSTNSKYETLRSRLLCNVSTQTSPKKSIGKVNRNLISKSSEQVKIDKNEETLMKACYTRCLKKSAIIIDETVDTEMENDIPNEEPLLKPVSTKYFSTLPKQEESSSDSNSEFIIKENVIKTCNEECDRKEIVTISKEIDEISLGSNETEDTEHTDSLEIEEISKNNCVSSSSGESNYSLAFKKIETDENRANTTTSIYEKKDSEESCELNNQVLVQSQSPLNSQEENNITCYEDIDSEEEYDVVNFEQFSAFNSLVNKLEELKAAQKEHALGLANESNNNYSCQNHLKSIESSLDNTENNYSSISASISSNLDSDNETSVKSSSSSNLPLTNQNIFDDVKINKEHLNNYQLNEDDTSNAMKLKNQTNEENKTGLSIRQMKKINALNNYFKTKVPNGGDQVAQKNGVEVQAAHENEDEIQDKILKAKESKQCDQILEEKTKQKFSLNWREWLGYK